MNMIYVKNIGCVLAIAIMLIIIIPMWVRFFSDRKQIEELKDAFNGLIYLYSMSESNQKLFKLGIASGCVIVSIIAFLLLIFA